jgi:D-threo-aldose 1-dehydrogenase
MQFEQRKVGTTDLKISTMGLGGASLGGNGAAVTESDGRMLVIDAFDAGIRYFDTAPFYGYGKSEHVMGDALRWKSDYVLSSKVGRILTPRRKPQDLGDQWRAPLPFEWHFDYSYDAVMRSYEDSMQRLGLNKIDILYIHDIDVYSHGGEDKQRKAFATAMEHAYRALDELRRNGDIKAIGIGVNEAKPIHDALQHGKWDVFLLAGRYTLLEQAPLHDAIPDIQKHGASIVIGGPFNSGILVGGDTFNYSKAPQAIVDRVKQIAAVCEAHKVPVAAAALQFTLAHPVVASVIPGPKTAPEFNQILEWWNVKIPTGLWADLKSAGVLDQAAPVPK